MVETYRCFWTQQSVKVKCVRGDVITYPYHCSTVEVKSLFTSRAQRRQQLQETVQGEVKASPSNSVQDTEDLEVEVEGVHNPLLPRGPVSEYSDLQEGEMVQLVVVDSTLPKLLKTLIHTLLQLCRPLLSS